MHKIGCKCTRFEAPWDPWGPPKSCQSKGARMHGMYVQCNGNGAAPPVGLPPLQADDGQPGWYSAEPRGDPAVAAPLPELAAYAAGTDAAVASAAMQVRCAQLRTAPCSDQEVPKGCCTLDSTRGLFARVRRVTPVSYVAQRRLVSEGCAALDDDVLRAGLEGGFSSAFALRTLNCS